MVKKKEESAAEVELRVWKEIAMKLAAQQQQQQPAPVVAIERKPVEPESREDMQDWSKIIHTCPVCGITGAVSKLFGTRWTRGIQYRQSNCISCRSKRASATDFERKRPYKPRATRKP